MTYRKTYERWLTEGRDEGLNAELQRIKEDENEIKLRFLDDMQFGTAGMRSIMGAGTMRINIYTIGKATQGLCGYVLDGGGKDRGIVVAYDSRLNSYDYAIRTCEVLAGNGIKAYIFDGMASVAELSFAVREKGAFGGVMITASHNPKEYNGYKVYAAYGGQLSVEATKKVTEHIKNTDIFRDVKTKNFEKGIKEGLIEFLGDDVRNKYYEKIVSLVNCNDEIKKYSKEVKVVYTPLYGTGINIIKNVLPKIGINNLFIVERQVKSDGSFATVKMPNPEDKTAMRLAIELAMEKNADIAIGTDPDADRMGAAAKDKNGEYKMLSGNKTGCILLSHILEKRKKAGLSGGYIVKSIVSTNMADEIAKSYGVECVDVLTGFRFISEIAAEKSGFVFGFEESYGYLTGDFVFDKDGCMAAVLLTEAICCFLAEGKTLLEKLDELYEKYGYYTEDVEGIYYDGLNGMEKMKSVMNRLRSENLSQILDMGIDNIEDYLIGERYYINGCKEKIELPKSDVLKFNMKNRSWVCIRPSGTEPKLKIYFNARAENESDSKYIIDSLKTIFMRHIKET